MAIPRAHAEQVAKVVGELVPLAEAIFPILRRPLAAELKSKISSIEAKLEVDAAAVLRFYGLTPEAAEIATLSSLTAAARQRLSAAFQGLINALEGDRRMTIAAFVEVLMTELVAAMDTHQRVKDRVASAWKATAGAAPEIEAVAKRLGVSIGDLEQMFLGDAAFSALMAFLDHTRGVLRSLGPRTILESRSGI